MNKFSAPKSYFTAVLAALMLISLLLTACSDDTGHSSEESGTSESAVDAPRLPAPSLRVQGTVCSWSAVAAAGSYNVIVTRLKTNEPVYESDIQVNSFDIVPVASACGQPGEYTVTVKALPASEQNTESEPSAPVWVTVTESEIIVTAENPEVVITELATANYVYPINGTIVKQWVELYNRTDSPKELSQYELSIGDLRIPIASATLQPRSFVVLPLGESVLLANGTLKLMKGYTVLSNVPYRTEKKNYSYDVSSFSETRYVTPGYSEALPADSVYINELMANNESYAIRGRICDWIEIYNGDSKAVSLDNYFVSRSENPYACRLPAVLLQPGSYYVLACGTDTDFNLPKEGGSLTLTRVDGVTADSVTYGAAENDEPFLRNPADYKGFATPGFANTLAQPYDLSANKKQLLITEAISANGKYVRTNRKYYDLVELYNASDSPILLSDFYLSDSSKALLKYRLPEITLNPGEYYVVMADEAEASDTIAPFSISADGETLYLSRADSTVCDLLKLPALPYNVSYGRSSAGYRYFESPTFGKANTDGCTRISETPSANVGSGMYSSVQRVTLTGKGELYYTLDDSEPGKGNGKLYNGEVIPVSATSSIRVRAYEPGLIPSEPVTFNYFISIPAYELPVAKVTLADDDMYGENGIYTNFLRTFTVPASFALYENGKEVISVGCGVEIHGAGSRYFDKKSFQLKFKSMYGVPKLRYKLFDNLELDEFETIVLRSGSQDQTRTMCRDELLSAVFSQNEYGDNVLLQAYRPVNLYVNDKYYGIYYIKEKINNDFVAAHENVSPESVTIVKEAKSLTDGTSMTEWNQDWGFVCNKDLTVPENFEYVKANFDLVNVADYFLMQIWCSNSDYGNMKMYKSSENDGKWRYIFFDADLSLMAYKEAYPALMMESFDLTDKRRNVLFCKLLKTAEFRQLFLERASVLIGVVADETRVLSILDNFEEILDADMHYTVYGIDYKGWKNRQLSDLRKYITGHNKIIISKFIEILDVTEAEREEYFPFYTE